MFGLWRGKKKKAKLKEHGIEGSGASVDKKCCVVVGSRRAAL